jgi:hypothetical protein
VGFTGFLKSVAIKLSSEYHQVAAVRVVPTPTTEHHVLHTEPTANFCQPVNVHVIGMGSYDILPFH